MSQGMQSNLQGVGFPELLPPQIKTTFPENVKPFPNHSKIGVCQEHTTPAPKTRHRTTQKTWPLLQTCQKHITPPQNKASHPPENVHPSQLMPCDDVLVEKRTPGKNVPERVPACHQYLITTYFRAVPCRGGGVGPGAWNCS